MNDQQLAALAEEARQRLGARKGANRLYRVPPLSAAIAAVAGQTSNPTSIRFRRPGIVLAMQGQVSDGLASTLATTEVRVQVGGTRELFTDGDGAQFAPFLALFGPNQVWFPLELPAIEGQDWTITYKNTSGAVVTLPSLIFSVYETG